MVISFNLGDSLKEKLLTLGIEKNEAKRVYLTCSQFPHWEYIFNFYLVCCMHSKAGALEREKQLNSIDGRKNV